MTKLDFHHFHVRHFNNVFEQSWCHCRVGATPASRSNCLQTCRIHHQVKYRRKNANTCIEAAILFSGHPYIGRHYRATLIAIVLNLPEAGRRCFASANSFSFCIHPSIMVKSSIPSACMHALASLI